MGIGRIRAGHCRLRTEEGTHHARPGALAGAWHERLRRVDEESHSRNPRPLAAHGRPLLETHDMTANDVLALIKTNLGSPWNESTYRDVIHAGDPNVEVKGIATTFMGTLPIAQKAHAAGLNVIVTHETTFWSDRD